MADQYTFLSNGVPILVRYKHLAVTSPAETERLGAFGELLVAQVQAEAAWRFDYGTTPNSRIVATVSANGGGVTVGKSRCILSTSAANNGSAAVMTRNRLRYLNGFGGLARFTAVFSAGKVSSSQYIGIGDSADGFFFGYNGVDFGILRRRESVNYFTAQDDWNGVDVSFSPQQGNVYQIRFQWLGFGFIRFFVLDPSDQALGYRLVHSIPYPNTTLHVSILNPTLPLRAEVANSGNTSDIVLMTPSGMAGLEGGPAKALSPLDIGNSFDAAATFANSSNNHLVTVRNKSAFGGVSNRIPVQINSISIARSGGAATAVSSNVRLYRNATTAGALTYADVDTNNSPMDTSVTTTTITSVNAERAYILTQNTTSQFIAFLPGELVLQPGDSLSVGVQDSGVQSTDAVVTINWVEQF